MVEHVSVDGEAEADNTVTLSQRMTLTNIRGLHARASAKFVTCAGAFLSHIEVTSHNTVGAETVVADSVMELLMLGSCVGEDITITATGPVADAEAALAVLETLLKTNFGELK
ncbi:MAG: HPr family phosphocarrier protein [Maricaulaceae bacterium]